MSQEIGERFARAVAAKDTDALFALLASDVRFKGLTPVDAVEVESARTVVEDVLLGDWIEPTDRIDALEEVRTGVVVDRFHVAYRLRGTNPDGPFLVEQQAYFTVEAEQITSLRILCSGFRPLAADATG